MGNKEFFHTFHCSIVRKQKKPGLIVSDVVVVASTFIPVQLRPFWSLYFPSEQSKEQETIRADLTS